MTKFEKGDRVEVISNCVTKGAIGTVTYCGSLISVRLSNNCFYNYNRKSLRKLSDNLSNKEEENNIYMDNFKVATIKFLDGTNTNRTYYYALYDELYAGDKVVVKTGHHGFAIAEIVDVNNEPQNKVECGREIVCHVDFTAYENRIVKAKRLAELKGKMNEKVKELQKTAIYEMLAEKDESLRSLLNEYKGLLEE